MESLPFWHPSALGWGGRVQMARHEDHAGSGADQGELSCPCDGAGSLEPSRQRLLLLDPWRPLLEGLHLHELLLRDSAQPKPGLILGALGARVVAQVRYFGL